MEKPKNILFITTDQQRQDTLPCYGLDFMRTPALDRLAREGVVFENCTSVSPVCQPARAAFMIGQYPQVNSVPDNFCWLRPDSPTIARLFNQAGWTTAAIGKMHFHPWNNSEGFQVRISAEDKRHYFRRDDYTLFLEGKGHTRDHPATFAGYQEGYGAVVSPLPEKLHIDSFTGEQAVQWIDGGANEPFFAWVSFNSPHDPYDPPADLDGLYADASIPQPVGSLAELEHKPAYQRCINEFYRNNLLYLTDYARMPAGAVRTIRQRYLETVTLVDRQVEKILAALERRGLLESTLVVFSSDHGDHLGDHGLPFKSTYYESALLVPLIVRGPGAAAGRRSRSPVNWLDLHATFLSLAGIEIPDHVQGRDLRDSLACPERDEAGQGGQAFSELLGSVMVRTDRYKLVLCDDGDGELYDLEEEPLEVRNHFRDPAFREIREDLSGRILGHLLANSRVRCFGGGRHSSDPERERCFADIRRRLEGGRLFRLP